VLLREILERTGSFHPAWAALRRTTNRG
jgi:hypothetical protein